MTREKEWVERMVKAEEECGDITVGSPERAQSPLEAISLELERAVVNEDFHATDLLDWAKRLRLLTPPASERTPAEGAEPKRWPTLQHVAKFLGWGTDMTDEAIYDFVVEREQLLRVAQELLETQQSHAASAETAIRERITSLRERAEKAEADVADLKEQLHQADVAASRDIRQTLEKLRQAEAALSSLQAERTAAGAEKVKALIAAIDDYLAMVSGECGAPFENINAERLDSARSAASAFFFPPAAREGQKP